MKKMILVALLLLVAPAMAAVDLSCDVDANTLTISYDASGEVELVRAFALDIEITGGATIEGVVSANADFYIYPGTIVIDANGDVTDVGSPVAPANDPGALGALGGSAITIEMGSLYEEGDANLTPLAADDLIVLELGNLANGSVEVSTNETRARIVLEDSTVVDANASCEISTSPCGTCATCKGDLNGDNWLTLTDMYMLIGLMSQAGSPYQIPDTDPAYNDCADINGDCWLTLTDMYMLIGQMSQAGSPYQIPCP